MSNRVFCNRTLNMKKIKYLGFDMDHTLVRYHTEKFEALSHKETLKKLVSEKHYPKEVLDIPFEYDRVIRGLVVDQKNGNLLKLNLHGAIRQSYHGTKPIDFRKQGKLYRGTLIDLNDDNFLSVDTAFSIAYGNLFSHLVDLKDGALSDSLPIYQEISQDILDCVDLCHRDGSLKDEVCRNVADYVVSDPMIAQNLERYKVHGKKLFVLTNSEYKYTKTLLDYSIKPHLKNHSDWSELFEYVITLAHKPRFFYDNLDFMKIDPESGMMVNLEGPIVPGIYQGGCARKFTDGLKIEGDDILYVGDHIYGDIVRLKKDCNWRTALVLEELDDEIEKNKKSKPIYDEIWKLMDKKAPFEYELQSIEDQRRETKETKSDPRIESLMSSISSIDKEISTWIQKHQSMYNPYWGEVMRTGNEESYFASQVERYACIYTTHLADILSSSPRTYFRSSRRRMPHELGGAE